MNNKLFNFNNKTTGELKCCPKCDEELEEARKTKLTIKDLKKQWFYSKFLICNSCGYIKFDNKYQIIIDYEIKRLLNF